jgi:hypothetical protein
MRKIALFLYLISSFVITCRSQELNCVVNIAHPGLEGDPTIFTVLQTSVYEFMNSRKWSSFTFATAEKIECTILITLQTRAVNVFTGTIQIQSRRPIYKSSYNSTMLNLIDKDYQITYDQGQPLNYDESKFTDNLTSVLAFYAYIIIGLDLDSYQLKGGTAMFEKAQSIVTNAQSAAEPGWQASQSISQRNRFWLAENLMNDIYSPIRESIYNYYRKGMDMFVDNAANAANARISILVAFDKLKSVHENKSGSYLMQLFFLARADEIVNIFSNAGVSPGDKSKVLAICLEIDPTNSSKYNKITK